MRFGDGGELPAARIRQRIDVTCSITFRGRTRMTKKLQRPVRGSSFRESNADCSSPSYTPIATLRTRVQRVASRSDTLVTPPIMSEKEQDPPADFSTSIMDPRLKSQRKPAIKAVVMASILMSVAIWALLSVFWGSTCTCPPRVCLLKRLCSRPSADFVSCADLLEHYFPNAKLYVYDFDSANNANPLLGPYVTQYMLSTLEQPTHMGVIIRDPSGKTIDDVITEIVQEKAWAAMVVNANASTMFREAIAGTGGLLNGEYAPAGALTVITEGARWFQVTDD